MSKHDKAKEYWAKLGNVPVNDCEEIDEEFDGYPVGTDIYTIWHDVEQGFNVSVAFLMNLN